MDKYEVVKLLEKLASKDEQCSRSCSKCEFQKVCDQINDENILGRLFNFYIEDGGKMWTIEK